MRTKEELKLKRDKLATQRKQLLVKLEQIKDLPNQTAFSHSQKQQRQYFQTVLERVIFQLNAIDYMLQDSSELHDPFFTHYNPKGFEALDSNLDFKEGQPIPYYDYIQSQA